MNPSGRLNPLVKTFALLDFYRVRDSIAEFCVSDEGKKSLLTREPLFEPCAVERLNREAKSLLRILRQTANSASILSTSLKPTSTNSVFAGWIPVAHCVPILRVKDAALTPDDAHRLLIFCRAAENTVRTFSRSGLYSEEAPLVAAVEKIPALTDAAALIGRVIDGDGNIRDLPAIKAIRDAIKRIRREIDEAMRSYTANPAIQDSLQSAAPALRAMRQTLAVKVQHKNKIRGIIHEVSQTGQTVYIEPADVVEKHNELALEEFHLEKEYREVMHDLTAQLAPFADDFARALETLSALDESFAAARWGISVDGIFADDGQPLLLHARHPLFGEKAVGIDIGFDAKERVLIISGANGGGKTAAIKTFALFALLNQSGFPLPAASGTHLPVFSGIFADIGDGQSFDESLSTFQAHSANTAKILGACGKNALVVLDELGCATDPEEGGALALAILDCLIEKKAFALITTHHGALKNYAYTHAECANAAVEFDAENLQPRYRVLRGESGESRAVDIAARCGMPDEVIAGAHRYLAGGHADVSALIRALTAEYAQARKTAESNRQADRALAEKTAQATVLARNLKQKEIELASDGERAIRSFLDEKRKMLENLVRTLREGEITREKTLAVKSAIAELTAEADKRNAALVQAQQELTCDTNLCSEGHYSKEPCSKPETFSAGMEVCVTRQKKTGIILHALDTDLHAATWLVQVGSVKMPFPESELSAVKSNPRSADAFAMPHRFDDFVPDAAPSSELKLLGMRHDEAIKTLERQLDLASIRGLTSFSIVHGKGDGILQNAVHRYLSAYPNVAEFYFARPEDGGSGKTYVKLA